ncbi:MAG TPA: DNA-3-methyladenine glycosylase [Verrucomicrobiae bacterium]|jgi:3-methyladenine DNA glycosylase/8-oxoguanine DNA glycosylase|nr:DNA-3-methyladenine glycosylase [Verrucomicrobiae bacterium]
MSPEAVEHLCRADKELARLIKKVGPCTMKPHRRRTPFVALVTAVTHQQLNGTAAKTILKRVLALYPGKRFPTPADILATPEDRLRAAGLSRAKVAAIKDIAAKTVAGIVPGSRTAIAKLSNEEILERLTSVRGVGPWTVEMLLMFTLGRLDILPATDYGVRKGFALTFGWKDLPTPMELLEYGKRWQPHRTTAAWYLWRALELPVP